MTTAVEGVTFNDLVQGPGERHLIYGGTRTGKSSLVDMSLRHIQQTRPCMTLLVDTKPRFRAERVAYGRNNSLRRNAEKQGVYQHWASGPMLPNSCVINMESEHPFRGMWNYEEYPNEIAILQSGDPDTWRTMNRLMKAFVDRPLKDQERLVVVDEGLDFYQRNTLGIDKHDVILHVARAGGERNIGLILNAHRPRGIPPLLNTLSSRVSLFHLNYGPDMKYLYDMGISENETAPTGEGGENYVFKQFVKQPGGAISAPIKARLTLPDSYLKQLAAT